MEQQQLQNENSVSIIEDCLNKIYRSRKANLITKSRKFREKQSRRELQNSYDKQHNKLIDTDNYDEEYNLRDEYSQDGEVLEELATKFRAPPLNAAVPYEKERSRVAVEYEEQDVIAEGVFEEFSLDIKKFVRTNFLKLSDEELRADACDEFIDKYLTQRLDHCITTRIVSKIRKKISNIIEYIASCDSPKELKTYLDQELNFASNSNSTGGSDTSATYPIDIDTDRSDSGNKSQQSLPGNGEANRTKNIISTDNRIHTSMTTVSPTSATALTMNSTKATAKSVEQSKESREKLEKKRIKEQYEQLMMLKKKSEAHPDDTAISQYTALHSDIQSVIDSIKNNKPVK
jgi:hypothetical protein